MKTMKKGIIPASILIALSSILATLIILLPKLQVANESKSFGSITEGQAYFATTTHSGGLSSGGIPMTSGNVLRVGTGSLGSVIITGAAAGQLNLYDGTTTLAHADRATTTLATFPVSTVAGTYVFDAGFKDGLVIEFSGTVIATSTITFR